MVAITRRWMSRVYTEAELGRDEERGGIQGLAGRQSQYLEGHLASERERGGGGLHPSFLALGWQLIPVPLIT